MSSQITQKITNQLTISVVLPVYNESTRILACLSALSTQTVKPIEIIVVDNNSSDDTAELARTFPGVSLITEARQGVVYARGAGFDAARGDIIARLDADTIVPENWLETILQEFASGTVDALSGAIEYYDVPFSRAVSQLDFAFRKRIARKLQHECFIQGTNSAIRRTAWLSVRDKVCLRGDLHEDFDLAIHLFQTGHVVKFCPEVRAAISARCVDDSFRSFVDYALINPGTYAQHGLASSRHMYPLIAAMVVAHPMLRAMYRVRNTGSFFAQTLPRVNPATFVD